MPKPYYWIQHTFDREGEPGPLLLVEATGPEVEIVTSGDDMQSLAEDALYNFNIVVQPTNDRVDVM